MTDREQRDALFRISEIREWVGEFIARGDVDEARYWAWTAARIGTRLLTARATLGPPYQTIKADSGRFGTNENSIQNPVQTNEK